MTKIVEIRHYDTLYSFLVKEGYDNVLSGIKSYEKAIEVYHKFYSDAKIKKVRGMNAVVLELVTL